MRRKSGKLLKVLALVLAVALSLFSGQPVLTAAAGQQESVPVDGGVSDSLSVDEDSETPPQLDYILGRPMTPEEEAEQREIAERNLKSTGWVEPEYFGIDISLSKSSQDVWGVLPSSYDSRDVSGKSYIPTEVRNQNPYGTCWAFASVACMESNLIKKGLADTSIDLSEAHLVYYSNFSAKDPLGNDGSDNAYYEGDYLDAGGNTTMTGNALMNWKGAVEEEKAPYTSAYLQDLGNKLGKNNITLAYKSSYAHLKGWYEISMSDTAAVKTAIMEYGAVAASYYHDDKNGKYYNASTAAYYCDYLTTNHAVTIVGWDDSYKKENFNTQPENNGAWLVRNSWGSVFGKNGYFWISYEDKSLNHREIKSDSETIIVDNYATVFDMELAGKYDNNYQYDHATGSGYVLVQKAASIFQAKANPGKKEELEAVSIKLEDSNVNYSVQVYRNLTNLSDPTSGEPCLSNPVKGSTTYAGYWTITLPQSVELNQGEYFSVVFNVAKEGTDKANVGLEYSTNNGFRISIASAEAGQSLINSGGTSWRDCSTADLGWNMNLKIKAFTNNVDESDEIKVTGISLNKTTLSIEAGKTETLTATVTPSNATNKTVNWTSSDSSVATVDSSGKVTAVKAGTAVITVTSKDGNYSAKCNITVTQPVIKVTGISLNKTTLSIEAGKAETLTVTVKPSNATNKTVNWTSSDSSVAKVDSSGKVTAVKAGTAVITVTSKDGNYSAKCNITVTQPVIKVTGISLNKTALSIEVGKAETLTASVAPSNAANKNVKWTSSDSSVAKVDSNGKVTAVKAGTAVITVTSEDGNYSASCTVTVILPAGGYIGNINTELYSFDLKQADNGGYYLTGQIIVVEWVNGESTVPQAAPTMIFKSTDGKEQIEVFVTPTGTNTYYFDRFIEGLSLNKEYVFEIASGSANNYSTHKAMNVSLATSPKMVKIKNLGKIGEQKISYYQAPNGELHLYRRNENYVGNINSELKKTELVTGPNGNYVSGEIVVVEWENDISTVPFEAPIMYFRSTDGKEVLPVWVTPTGTNTYYFDRSLGDLDTSKEYIFTIESGDQMNVSPNRSMVVTTAAMSSKEGTLWESPGQYVKYRTDSKTGQLRIYGVNK